MYIYIYVYIYLIPCDLENQNSQHRENILVGYGGAPVIPELGRLRGRRIASLRPK
jgi:hypothetical protein